MYTRCTRGNGLTHLSTCAKSPFMHVFWDTFIRKVFWDTSTILCCVWYQLTLLFYKASATIISCLPNISQSFSMELLIGYLKTFLLEMKAQIGKCMCTIGGS